MDRGAHSHSSRRSAQQGLAGWRSRIHLLTHIRQEIGSLLPVPTRYSLLQYRYSLRAVKKTLRGPLSSGI
jgi:hypothetical protein